jgi:hypothetical protein
MSSRALRNPNLCAACGNLLDGEQPATQEDPGLASASVWPPLEHFLEAEGASVLECYEALEQARRALAESDGEEQRPPAPRLSEDPGLTTRGENVHL